MDWQAYGKSIGLPVDGAMGAYYRPQIEEAMRNEQARQGMVGSAPGFQAQGSLTGGNNMGALVQQTNDAAGRVPQASQPTMQAQPVNPYMPTMQAQSAPMQAPQPAQAPQMPMPAGPGPTTNPWLGNAANWITQQATQTLNRDILPAMGRGAAAVGGYGDSRSNMLNSLAVGDTMKNITGQLGSLAFNQYNTDNNFDLQSWLANQQVMRQGQQDQLNLADRMLGWNQNYGVGNATQVQNTPLNYWQQFANTGAQLGGLGGTSTQNLQGNPLMGAIGGYQIGKSLFGG